MEMENHDSGATEEMKYELLVIHAEAATDSSFVRSELLPSLGLPSDRVMLSSELPLGGFAIDVMEAALRQSRVTMVVVSPAFLEEKWTLFSEALATYQTIEGSRSLVPILLADCKMPLRLKARVTVDLRDPRNHERGLRRLRAMFSLSSQVAGSVQSPSDSPLLAESASFWTRLREYISQLAMLLAIVAIILSLQAPRRAQEGASAALHLPSPPP